MLWFGKKKKALDEEVDVIEEDKELDTADEVEEELDLDEDVDEVSEDEILDELNSDGNSDGEIAESAEADESDSEEATDDEDVKADVVKTVSSLDELVEHVNGKAIGAIQFLRKENNEVFDLREVYLRIARVWGSVSMAREYTPAEYAKIMLAIHVIESPDDFYVLPVITDEEREKAIIDFCEEKYGGSGKKYARNVDKFAKLVNENGDKEDWLAHTKCIVTEKITEFCEKNGITFDSIEKADEIAEGEADE